MLLKLATNDRSDKMFLLVIKFRPQGVVSPCPGAIYMYKIMKKKCIKSDFKVFWFFFFFFFFFWKLVANDRSDKRFLLTSKFCFEVLSASDLRLYTFIKSCIMSEVESILFKIATNDNSDEAFLLT